MYDFYFLGKTRKMVDRLIDFQRENRNTWVFVWRRTLYTGLILKLGSVQLIVVVFCFKGEKNEVTVKIDDIVIGQLNSLR